MIKGIDHVVIISPDLEHAVANATAAGFTVVPGGTHADGATHNAIVAFADGSYIELISPTDNAAGKDHRWFPRLALGGGLVDMCLLSDDLAADAQSITQAGRAYIGPVDNGRARPDGEILKWKGAFPHGAVGESGWPFLIEDVTPRSLRVPHAPDQVHHANGATGIAGVSVHTSDLERTTSDYEAITGTSARREHASADGSLVATIIQFPQGWIQLRRPTDPTEIDHMEKVGLGPVALTLRTHDGPVSPGHGTPLPPELMGGSHLELD